MSETNDFFIINYEDKSILVFNSAEIEISNWYLPNFNSVDNLNRQIAIETDLFKNEYHIAEILNNETTKRVTKQDIIDWGNLIIESKSRYKMKFKLLSKSVNQMFVMIAPSWGRWTKKQIWLIISSKQ